jgi:hypothetical protein
MHDYDFLAGECQYKRSLAKGLRMLHWTTVHRGGWMTEVFLLARKLKNALREQVS